MMSTADLRTIYRVLPDGTEERVRMAEIKAGDKFRIQDEPDGHAIEFAYRVFEATADARLIDGIWGVSVQWD